MSHLIVGEVNAGQVGEGAAGGPGENVLTLAGSVDPGLGQDREERPLIMILSNVFQIPYVQGPGVEEISVFLEFWSLSLPYSIRL